MTTIVTKENPITVPDSLRRRAGISPGDRVEIKATGGVITIVAQPPREPEKHTVEQRRAIDARLTEARKGPYHGPFDSAEEAIAFLRKETKSRRPATKK